MTASSRWPTSSRTFIRRSTTGSTSSKSVRGSSSTTSGVNPKYRGGESRADVALAMGFSGHMNIELIQPHNDTPSVYQELIDRSGYGFHHWGVATSNFDRDLEKYRAAGHEVAFLCAVPS